MKRRCLKRAIMKKLLARQKSSLSPEIIEHIASIYAPYLLDWCKIPRSHCSDFARAACQDFLTRIVSRYRRGLR
jgi:hypothetical protein